ncbi:MAG TPA: hypothetical protein VIF62_04170 [Labilithrix sp.]|jgi:hypothetical protein
MKRGGTFVVAAVVALAACGLSVTGAEIIGADGGSPPPASLPDGAPADAAGDDANDDASVLQGCAAPHALCDDFDLGLDAGRWSDATIAGGGILGLSADAASPPNALEVTVPARGGGNVYASLDKIITQSMTRIRCTFEVFPVVREPLDGQYYDMIAFELAPLVTMKNEQVYVRLRTTADSVQESGGYGGLSYTIPLLTAGAWHPFVIDVDLGKSSLEVDVDGVKTTQSNLQTVPSATSVTIHFGASHSYSDTGSLFRFDDVVCDVFP